MHRANKATDHGSVEDLRCQCAPGAGCLRPHPATFGRESGPEHPDLAEHRGRAIERVGDHGHEAAKGTALLMGEADGLMPPPVGSFARMA